MDKMILEDFEINEDFFWYFVYLWGGVIENIFLIIWEIVLDV